jgi:hypothetical protein
MLLIQQSFKNAGIRDNQIISMNFESMEAVFHSEASIGKF